jgi:hypothetical protein
MIDVYTKAVLTVIALALIALVARPLFTPGPAQAEGPVAVRVVGWDVSQISVHASLNSLPIQVECVRGCAIR